MERLIAIGDIHGCVHTLKNLLKSISYSSSTDTLVFIGDYIDRGYYSCETVAFLRKLQQQAGREKCICLRGNHEQFAIDAGGVSADFWNYNGSLEALASYERNGADIADDLAWFKSLPLVYDTPKIIFCHAGLSHPKLKDNSEDDLLWGRAWIGEDARPREKQVVFGHTPSAGSAYITLSGDICIDAGCAFGGSLCALVIEESGESVCYYERKADEDDPDIDTDEIHSSGGTSIV